MDTTLDRPPIGQLLDGRYLVESYLAPGGMATVYLGTDTRLDRTVALKIMHAELANDEEFVRRFVAEARSVARLSHPNVVTVYDQGADGRLLYLAMEYVPGRTLRDLLAERGRLSPREALDVMDGVLGGLAAAHAAGIAHRDVKPENVLLGDGHTVKVADFGLARLLSAASHTRSGLLIGTAAYLAPEQVASGAADARTDVYAAGVMLFELLTGTQPHTAETPLAVAYKHVNEIVPPPSAVVPGLPPALDSLVALATSRNPELRPADAGRFLDAVSGARASMGLHGVPAPGLADPVPGASDDDTIPPGSGVPAVPAAWPDMRPRWPAEPSGDLVPGMAPPPSSARQSFGLPSNGAPPMVPAQQFPGNPHHSGLHQTLVVAGGAAAPFVTAPGYVPPREPRLQRLLFSRRLGYLAIALAVVLVAGVLGWWLTAGRYATVPKVTGISAAAAAADLRHAGLTATTGKAQLSNTVPKGDVIRSLPPAGAKVPRGGRVTLIVSAGPHMIAMPQVTGQTLAAAEHAIQQAGLVPGKVVTETSATIADGIVISTNPAVSTPWPQTKPVTLVVSAGPPVPNFVGQPKAVAEGWATANGVNLNEVTAHKSNQLAGNVIHQSVKPGSPFTKGQVITIVISPGPPIVAIPDVTGMRTGQAVHLLQHLGFHVQVTGGLFSQGKVITYSPQGSAPKGSVITLTVALLPLG